jgi:hypothetical protein
VYRRTVLRASLATGALSLSAGCNGLFGGDPPAETTPDRTATTDADAATGDGPDPANDGPGGTRATATASPEPYRAADAPALDAPRGVRLRNLGTGPRYVTLVVRHGGADVFVASRTVAARGTTLFPALVATAGEYEVVCETADGSRRAFGWTVGHDASDLWVGLGGPGAGGDGDDARGSDISVRRLALCGPDCPALSTGGESIPSLRPPDDLSLDAALGRTPAVALDNGGSDVRAARLRLWDGDRLHFDFGYRLPAGVRALVPLQPSIPRYRVGVSTADGEARHEWFPGVRATLYADVAGVPRVRCGLAAHDLRVRNETGAARVVRVRVTTGAGAGDAAQTLYEGSFDLAAGTAETVAGAVDAAGVLSFRVETDDGRSKTVDWGHCAPNGTLVVSIRAAGVLVSTQPELES